MEMENTDKLSSYFLDNFVGFQTLRLEKHAQANLMVTVTLENYAGHKRITFQIC